MQLLLGRRTVYLKRFMSTLTVHDNGETVRLPPTKFHPQGAEINYARTGTGAHALLCLPGALGSWRTDFLPQLNDLNAEKYTIIAWDPPGYGRSKGERRFDRAMFHADAHMAHALMTHLDLLPYSLLGWSDGAITGLHMSSNNKISPHLRSQVLFGGQSHVTSNDVKIYEGIRDIRNWSEKMRLPFVQMYGLELFQKMWHDWCDLFINIYGNEDSGNICTSALKDIDLPTLIIHGQLDPVVPQAHAEFLEKNIRNAKLLVWPEGKHNLHLRHVPWFNKHVEEFFDTIDEQAKL